MKGKYKKLIEKERDLIRQLQSVREEMKLMQNPQTKKAKPYNERNANRSI